MKWSHGGDHCAMGVRPTAPPRNVRMYGLPLLTVAMALKNNQPPSSVLFVAALNSTDFALGLSRSLAHSPTAERCALGSSNSQIFARVEGGERGPGPRLVVQVTSARRSRSGARSAWAIRRRTKARRPASAISRRSAGCDRYLPARAAEPARIRPQGGSTISRCRCGP